MSYQTQFTSPLKFLGAYVSNASLSMGWNNESGYCNLELVEEPNEGVIFQPPALGTACLFQAGKLSFGGILKKYDYKVSAGEGKRYNVVIENPSAILNGVYLILNKFGGTIYIDDYSNDIPELKPLMTYGGKYPTNIINVYAHKESYMLGGQYGSADLNELGYPVKTLLSDIKATMADTKYGLGGKIVYSETSYDLDLSELQTIINSVPGLRIPGNFITINELISRIADYGLFDYTYTITGTPNSLGVITSAGKPTIKLRVLSRRIPPTPNAIKNIIESYNANADKNLISYSIGKEIPDVTTQQVLFGGQASRYWLANRDYIFPIWGSIGQGQNATYFYGNDVYEYGNPFAPIRLTIDGGGEGYGEGSYTYIDTNLLEIRCALSGREAWTAYHIIDAYKKGIDGITFGDFKIRKQDFVKLLQGQLVPNELFDTDLDHAQILASYMYGMFPPNVNINQAYAQKVIESRFNSINKTARQFYGREFLVQIPAEMGGVENNFRWIDLEKKYESAWEVDSSAWGGDNSGLFCSDISFFDGNGRLESVSIFPNYANGDYSVLGDGYGRSPIYGTNGGVITKSSIDSSWGIKWLDFSVYSIDTNGNIITDSAGKPVGIRNTTGFVKAVMQEPIPIYDEYTSMYNGFNSLCYIMLGMNRFPGYHNLYGFENFDFALAPSYMAPEYIGVPQKSNRYVWGPWYSFNLSNGQKGKIEIQEDPQMSPENFGSIKTLNEAATTMINAELAQIAETETGYMEIADLPQYSLADRFFDSGPYITSISINVSANGGFVSTYNFQNWTKKFAAFARYNIDQFTKNRSHNFQFLKQFRDLYRNPVAFPLGKVLALDKTKYPKVDPSHSMVVGFMKNLARSINNPNDETPKVNVQSSTQKAAMRGLGLNYMESFGSSMEQIYTPVLVYNQRSPEEMKRQFNRGNI